MNIHEITNLLARNTLTREQRGALVRRLASQMRDGYRFACPVLVLHGRPVLGIALLAKADDRLARLPLALAGKPIRPAGRADHVFVLLCYEQEGQWLNQAKSVIAVYPEQPDAEEFCTDFGHDQTTGPPRSSGPNRNANTEELRKAVAECFKDAVRAGLANPVVCCLDTSDDVAKELAMNHISALLPRFKAKVFDAQTGKLRPVESIEFHGRIAVQAWPPEMLLDAMREMGAPRHWLTEVSHQLMHPPQDHYWLMSITKGQPLLAPMPKPSR